MARQGSLCQRIPPCCAPSAGLVLLTFVACTLFSANATANDQTSFVDINLTYSWKSTSEKQFVRLEFLLEDPSQQGKLSGIRNQSTADSIAGAFELRDDQTLVVQPRLRVTDGQFVFRIRAPRDATLVLKTQSGTRPDFLSRAPRLKRLALKDLAAGDVGGGDVNSLSWSLARVPFDSLRVESLNTFFDPSSALTFQIRVQDFAPHASQAATLQYALIRVEDGEIVGSRRWPITFNSVGNSDPVEVSETAPAEPGVYEVRCEIVHEDDDIWSRFRRREDSLLRVGQPIVILPPPDNTSEKGSWETAGVIRPSESSWSVGQWLPKQTNRLIPSVVPEIPPELKTQQYADQLISLIPAGKDFQATLPVKQPGTPHKVTLRFAADRNAKIRVDIGRTAQDRDRSFVISSARSSDPDQPWWTHSFVHYPAGDDQIWLTNQLDEAAIALESITVETGPQRLAVDNQLAKSRSTILQLEDMSWVDTYSSGEGKRLPLHQFDVETAAVHRLWIATQRLQDYAHANGMNGVMIPVTSGPTAWFESTKFHAYQQPGRNQQQRLPQFLRLMQSDQLDVFLSLPLHMPLTEIESVIRSNSSMLQSLVREGSGWQYNLLHPSIQEQIVGLTTELNRACQGFGNFAGVAVDCNTEGHLEPLDESAIAKSGTLLIFAQASRRIMGPQLQTWAATEGKDQLATWITTERTKVLNQLRQTVSPADLFVLDHSSTKSDQSLTTATKFFYGPKEIIGCTQQSLQGQLSSTESESGRAVFLDQDTMAITDLARHQLWLDVGRISDRINPSAIVIADRLLASSLQKHLKQNLVAFAQLPPVEIKRVDPIDPAAQSVQVAVGTHEGHTYLSIFNRAPWDTDVDLEFTKPINWEVLGLDDTSVLESKGSRTRVNLAAGQLVVVKSESTDSRVQVKSWLSRVSGGGVALERIKRKVTLIVESIGVLTDLKPTSGLTNGGFEQSGGVGLVGWLHAQHPPGCVQVDEREAREGKQSVLLTTDAAMTTRTWLVSETIDPPTSGRLAVSLACRAEKSEAEPVHQLRVSIETTRNGLPVRFSSDVEVPRNGQWGERQIVLEAENVSPQDVKNLRLTIDSLSGGRVWIDDIQIHDQFPTSKERAELQRLAFLAVQGLQRGNLTASAKLLQNDWARHLLALPRSDATQPVIERVKPPEEPPGVADRIRSWLPRPLRF